MESYSEVHYSLFMLRRLKSAVVTFFLFSVFVAAGRGLERPSYQFQVKLTYNLTWIQ